MMVVIGGSLGGCAALREVLRVLPTSFPAPIAVVLHRHRDSAEILVPVVQHGCPLPVCEAEDKMPAEPGQVYLCPPDYHLLLESNRFSLSTDDLVNYARPSIDMLFESAAEWKGRDIIAVVLTGSGSDGAAGAKRVAQCGGTVLVQDPKTAEGPWMPTAAIESTKTLHVLTLAQISERLIALTRKPS